jgi:hypothetical protein
MQAIGYACDIPPNGAINGVWLRSPKLKPTADPDTFYKTLDDDDEKKRAYHPSTFGIGYRTWVTNRLLSFVNSDGSCKSTGHAGLVNELRDLRADMIEGTTDDS